MLILDPEARLSAKEAINHSWMREDDAKLESHDLQSNLPHLRLFNARRKFKVAIKTVILAKQLSNVYSSHPSGLPSTTRKHDGVVWGARFTNTV